MRPIAYILALLGGFLAWEAIIGLKKPATATASTATPSSGTSGSPSPSAFPTGAGHLLPQAWYNAIQANESTLPLPMPGSPQPMFGITQSPYAVGIGHFSSGGTAAASASLGVPAGTTVQALFPTVDAGIAGLDAIIKGVPGTAPYIGTGDFCGFLRALAPHYAGPGEVQQWPTQVGAHAGVQC